MASVTVSNLAKILNIDEKILLEKLEKSGISKKNTEDHISDFEKNILLDSIMNSSNDRPSKNSISLQRKITKQLKANNKKIRIEVRKKRISLHTDLTAKTLKLQDKLPIVDNKKIDLGQEIISPVKNNLHDALSPLPIKLDVHKDSTLKVKKSLYTEENSDGFRIVSKTKDYEVPKKNDDNPKSKNSKSKQKIDSKDNIRSRSPIKRFKTQKKYSSKISHNLYDDLSVNKKIENTDNKLNPNKNRSHQFVRPTVKKIKKISLFKGMSVGEISRAVSIKTSEIIKKLQELTTKKFSINDILEIETCKLLLEKFGHKWVLCKSKEEVIEESLLKQDLSSSDLQNRPPVVTIMGHVDHGKTSLLDYIRKSHVASNELGSITQHMGAYSVSTKYGDITFLDTPGHEAFTLMRSRGISITDIVVLVVAADDGVMPQTIESIQHAQAASVPIIVAINKIDKLSDNKLEQIKTQLSQQNIISEEWGGETIFVHISATLGKGINDLLENIILQSEMLELKASKTSSARGTVIDSKIEKGKGIVSKILIKSGLLKKGDVVISGVEYGKIRAIINDNNKKIDFALPSMPVEIFGLSGAPNAGDPMAVVENEKIAREIVNSRIQKMKDKDYTTRNNPIHLKSALHDMEQLKNQKKYKKINIILKTDFQGSMEAIKSEIFKLSNNGDDVKVEIISSGVGVITSSDVILALSSGAIILGFNVRADNKAKEHSNLNNININYYRIIYDIVDDIKNMIAGMTSPKFREKILGSAEVRSVFRSSKFGSVAGSIVSEGLIKRNSKIRVLREYTVIYEGFLESLKRFKEDVTEVKKGLECGIAVKDYNDVKVGDSIEVFESIDIRKEK